MILFLSIACIFIGHNKPKKEIVIQKIPSKPELIHDTIPQEVPVYLPGELIVKDTTIYVTVIEKVDTSAILRDYLVFNTTKDTLKLSNNQGFVYLNETINQNKIVDRKFSATIKPKTIRETPPPPPPIRNQVFLGLNGAISNEDWVNSIGLGLILKTKNDHLYHINLGVANRTIDGTTGELRPYVGGGVYWKLKLKKN